MVELCPRAFDIDALDRDAGGLEGHDRALTIAEDASLAVSLDGQRLVDVDRPGMVAHAEPEGVARRCRLQRGDERAGFRTQLSVPHWPQGATKRKPATG